MTMVDLSIRSRRIFNASSWIIISFYLCYCTEFFLQASTVKWLKARGVVTGLDNFCDSHPCLTIEKDKHTRNFLQLFTLQPLNHYLQVRIMSLFFEASFPA